MMVNTIKNFCINLNSDLQKKIPNIAIFSAVPNNTKLPYIVIDMGKAKQNYIQNNIIFSFILKFRIYANNLNYIELLNMAEKLETALTEFYLSDKELELINLNLTRSEIKRQNDNLLAVFEMSYKTNLRRKVNNEI